MGTDTGRTPGLPLDKAGFWFLGLGVRNCSIRLAQRVLAQLLLHSAAWVILRHLALTAYLGKLYASCDARRGNLSSVLEMTKRSGIATTNLSRRLLHVLVFRRS